MMEEKLLKNDINSSICCQHDSFSKINKNIDSKNMAKSGAMSFKHKNTTERNWFIYLVYIHFFMLYFLIIFLYYDLKQTKETIFEYQLKMINVTMEEMEVEKSCLSEINKFKNSIKYCGNRRMKRELQYYGDFVESLSSSDISELKTNLTISSESDSPQERPTRGAPKDRRGKKHRKKNRRRTHGLPKASHYVGAYPEAHIKDGGFLSPWVVDRNAIKDFHLLTKVPSRGRDSVEIVENGLYFIYAQVYYMNSKGGPDSHNSFSIMLKRRSNAEVILARCATHADSGKGGDSSCFTGTAYSLAHGDIVSIKQQERDRNIIMEQGQTYFGLVLLNKK